MKGTAWRVYLGIGALTTGACYLLPYDPARAVLNLVVGASACPRSPPASAGTGRSGGFPGG